LIRFNADEFLPEDSAHVSTDFRSCFTQRVPPWPSNTANSA
jgi:hypothetical protein